MNLHFLKICAISVILFVALSTKAQEEDAKSADEETQNIRVSDAESVVAVEPVDEAKEPDVPVEIVEPAEVPVDDKQEEMEVKEDVQDAKEDVQDAKEDVQDAKEEVKDVEEPEKEPPVFAGRSFGNKAENAEPLDTEQNPSNDNSADIETFPKATDDKLGRQMSSDWDSLTSRYAPDNNRLRGTGVPYTLTEQRLREVRAQFMYYFYDMGGGSDNIGDWQNNIQSSTPTIHKNLNFQLPFFGFRFNYTRVSLNGYLEFSDPPVNYETYPLVFPVKDWPKKNDPSFIGIFHSRCRIGGLRAEEEEQQKKPGVYFRLERDLRERTDQFGVEFRERLKWDIRQGVIGSESFDPKHAITVTWKNVSFAGGFANAMYVTNTFQMVLATDEVFTYAIFNYLDLQWTTHTEAGGDTTTGEGGVPAYIGFNAGNGTRSYEYKPYSQGTILRDLSSRGYANGFPGRHIFRIDENILLGTCNKDIDDANLPLFIAPESGNMLGGTIVNITGPCFESSDIVKCKFDTIGDEVIGLVINKNRAICVQPSVYVEGYINLQISVGTEKYKWKGKYFIESPASATEKIFFDTNMVNQKFPPQIKLTWVKSNLTNNDNAPVRISLWGYREKTTSVEFVYIDKIADAANTGEYIITPSSFKNRDTKRYMDMKFGFIQINLTESVVDQQEGFRPVEITPLIWSRPMPLAWYFVSQWQEAYGNEQWPQALCSQWMIEDRKRKNFANELAQCPCTLEHALYDKGKYLPDFNCDKDTNPRCMFNQGAIHCVRSGLPSQEGAEQLCCYDKNKYLMLTYDQVTGSTPFLSHNLGAYPWNEATKVPTLSQWYNDIVPKYVCCIWQDNPKFGLQGSQAVECETLRFERRPTQDCVSYQPPSVAGVFGDPHIVTFDDYEYTFNGMGEYALVYAKGPSANLEVQGRFEKMPNNAYGEVKATQLTAVAAKGNSTVIEVRRRAKEARWRYRLDVLADGKRIYFDRPSLKFQRFPGVLVYTPTYILNQSEVVIMFDTGAGVEIIENQGYMTARVYLPWQFINKTRGLFGNWSFDMQDDLALPGPGITTVPITTNINDFENIYRDFGQQWMLEDKDNDYKGHSLFYRENGKTSSSYNNKTFVPEFRMELTDLIPPNRSQEIQKAEDYCHEYYQCKYDYGMTYDRDLAHFSFNYLSSIKNIKEVNNKLVVSCGVLETPRFGRKSNYFFIPGTKVTFECDEQFMLIGDPRRECMENGMWDIPKHGYTQCLRMEEYDSRTAAYTWAIILGIIVSLLIILAFIGYKLLKRRKKLNEDDTDADEKRRMPEMERSINLTPPDDFYNDDDNISIPSVASTQKHSMSPVETEIH